MNIKVLGSGCKKCKDVYDAVKEVINGLNVNATVEKVENVADIVDYGVMVTPGLVINGKVKVSGKVPSKEDIKKMINEEH